MQSCGLMHVFSLTQNREGRAGPQLGVTALHHVDSRVGHSDGSQSERSSEGVEGRSAIVTGEDGLLVAHPGEDEGLSQ